MLASLTMLTSYLLITNDHFYQTHRHKTPLCATVTITDTLYSKFKCMQFVKSINVRKVQTLIRKLHNGADTFTKNIKIVHEFERGIDIFRPN